MWSTEYLAIIHLNACKDSITDQFSMKLETWLLQHCLLNVSLLSLHAHIARLQQQPAQLTVTKHISMGEVMYTCLSHWVSYM